MRQVASQSDAAVQLLAVLRAKIPGNAVREAIVNRRQFFKRAVAAPAVAAVVAKGEAIAGPSDLTLWADGEHDDTTALNAWWNGKPVKWDNGKPVAKVIQQRLFLVNSGLAIDRRSDRLVLCGFRMSEAFDAARLIHAARKL